MPSHQSNSKTKNLVLLLKTIWKYWNCFLSPVATDGTDGNGLKFEKIGQLFQVLMPRVGKILKKFIIASSLCKNSFDTFVVALQKLSVYDWSLKVMILAQNWPKTAKSLWHCPFKDRRTARMRHNQNYNKNVRWLKMLKKRTWHFGCQSTAFNG